MTLEEGNDAAAQRAEQRLARDRAADKRARMRRFAQWLRDSGVRWHDHDQDPDSRYS
jgi:hypothetical protein